MTCSTIQTHPPHTIIQKILDEIRITKYVILNITSESMLKFYDKITRNRKITKAIISNAIEWKVPINFAFAMARKESEFNLTCQNYNAWNDSWDRGLFQLNDKSFTLSEDECFDPDINSHNGLKYFHEQLTTFNNSYTAMLAYNWGPNRVRAGKTPPPRVVNYVKDIKNYEKEYNELSTSQFKI